MFLFPSFNTPPLPHTHTHTHTHTCTHECTHRCGHCKNLAPHWASAATELKGKVKLGALDATVHTVMASRYGIQGFPTIKYFPSGRKDWDSALDYDGGRTGSDIVQWATNKWSENLPPPEVYQVLEVQVLCIACISLHAYRLLYSSYYLGSSGIFIFTDDQPGSFGPV